MTFDYRFLSKTQKKDLAKTPNTPPEILHQLATDENYSVRVRVAQNRNTPTKSLELLATDEDSYVRYWVEQHPNRTELIERLVFMTGYQLSNS